MPTASRTRFRVELNNRVAARVQKLAAGEDVSVSKAIETLITAGLDERTRKRKFLSKLNQNLANADPRSQDRMVDEFRDLILGQ